MDVATGMRPDFSRWRDWRREHGAAAAGVAVLHAAVAWLVLSQSVVVDVSVPDALAVFDVVSIPEPPPEAPEPPKAKAPRPEGEASAANRRARPTEIVAPKAPIELPPPPVVAAPVAAKGPDPDAGAAAVDGPGTGAGGSGTGLGSGGQGAGTGGGGGGAPRWLKGRIKDSDYPDAASRARVEGTVTVAFEVGTDGRARNCRITLSSGSADLDGTTCRLIEKRFRYKPATDAAGRPVVSTTGWRQTWWLEGD